MSEAVTKNKRSAGASALVPRLFVLELNAGRIHSMNTDGSDRKTIVTDCHLPDGIVVDAEAGHIYWTNMGVPNLNDGSIERADIDGRNRKIIVPQGVTHTPKQIHLDKEGGKLYWCDREGMRVMRAISTARRSKRWSRPAAATADRRDQTRWCVGITIDPKLGQIYWTQKGPDNAGLGRLFRANVEIPEGREPGEPLRHRGAVSISLPEPIDLELDLENRVLYWTDRGDPPRGNTVNRAPIDKKRGAGDPDHAPDGGDRHRPRRSRQPDVRHRLRRLGLFRRSRWKERAQLPLRPGQSHRHRLRRNLTNRIGEMT